MTTDADKIIKKLSKLEKEEGKLPLLLEFYRRILHVQSGVRKQIGAPRTALSRETIQNRVLSGQPLVSARELELNLDWSLVQEVFAKTLSVFARYPELFGEIPEKFKKPGAGRLLTKKAFKAWFTGKELPAALLDGVSDSLMRAVIQATLQPFLSGYSRSLMKLVEIERWRRGYCPICGGSPDLASLKKDVGARWLLCSRCDTEWIFQRLECPYCGNSEQSTLSYYSDEQERYRVYVCEKCRCYLKAVDLRKGDAGVSLPLERLYTLDLDNQARQYGYTPFQNPPPANNK